MRGNTAAGSERVGFHTDGEACDAAASSAWTGELYFDLHNAVITVAELKKLLDTNYCLKGENVYGPSLHDFIMLYFMVLWLWKPRKAMHWLVS